MMVPSKRQFLDQPDVIERSYKRQNHLCAEDQAPGQNSAASGHSDKDTNPFHDSTLILPQAINNSVLSRNDPKSDYTCGALKICFGMVRGIQTQFLDDPSIVNVHFEPEPDVRLETYVELRIVMKRIHVLETKGGKEIAILNVTTSKALQKLEANFLATHTVYVSTKEWTEKIRLLRIKGKSVCMEIDINFYGSSPNSRSVGRILSDTGHYLQPPNVLDNDIIYDNPHEINFLDMRELNALPTSSAPPSSIVGELSVDTLNVVLDNLDHTGTLTAYCTVDESAITTDLKAHQEYALNFIAKREAYTTPPEFSLFKQLTDSRNRTFFEHVAVSCRRSERSKENIGGIIADEMGLGKSLTMISAISISRDQAYKFQDDGSQSSGSMCQARATLVICPGVLLMDAWINEVTKHTTPGSLKCTRFHGTTKATDAEMLDSDIVLTTYATLISDSNRGGILHRFVWYRIILDEAHSIRHQQTRQFHAVLSLSARYRWCLTGTPIQNTLSDLGALIRFLRVPLLDGPADFSRHIAGPIERRSGEALQRLRELLRCVCLRRTKDILHLSQPDSHIESVNLTMEEQEVYRRIGEEHKKAIDDALARGQFSEASSGLFRAVLRLRIFCNTGLSVDSDQIDSDRDERWSLLEQDDQAVCSFCSCSITTLADCESAGSGLILRCSHLLCIECVNQGKTKKNRVTCMVCGKNGPSPETVREKPTLQDSGMVRLDSHSSKLAALLRNVIRGQPDKCIVFSSWKKSINIAAAYLTANNIPVCVIDGSMTLPERRAKISRFQHDPALTVLLMTLGTGAVGLTLTVANHVHILEPQWNPSIEKQAIGRVLRLGQEKKVSIIRYVTDNTVEKYIQNRQEKKLYIAQVGWNSSTSDADEEKIRRITDMESLLVM